MKFNTSRLHHANLRRVCDLRDIHGFVALKQCRDGGAGKELSDVPNNVVSSQHSVLETNEEVNEGYDIRTLFKFTRCVVSVRAHPVVVVPRNFHRMEPVHV